MKPSCWQGAETFCSCPALLLQPGILGRLVPLWHIMEQLLYGSSHRVLVGAAGPFPPRGVWSLLSPLPQESSSLW